MGVRRAGLPRDRYGAALALTTDAGTCRVTVPLTDRRLRRSEADGRLVLRLLPAIAISYPRNLARWLRAWVISVLPGDSSSLRSSRKNAASFCLISSASALGPDDPSQVSSA